MWYTYVLYSLKSKRKYIGYTSDLRKRLQEHNSGKGGQFTNINKPFKLIHYEAFIEKSDAQRQEQFYKTGYGREVLNSKLESTLKSILAGVAQW